jgi:hypothetical protein
VVGDLINKKNNIGYAGPSTDRHLQSEFVERLKDVNQIARQIKIFLVDVILSGGSMTFIFLPIATAETRLGRSAMFFYDKIKKLTWLPSI